jgi:predicted nucleic acid-binding protein
MVLVDTSVWIRAGAGQAPYAAELKRLLLLGQVVGHELIYGELLMGDRGARKKLLEDYERMFHARVVPHEEVVGLVLNRELHGRGVGWIDVHLLASALAGRLRLWTADPRFAEVAHEFGIDYRFDAA